MLGVKGEITVFVLRAARRAVIERELGGGQPDLAEVERRIHRHGEYAEELIVQIDLYEIFVLLQIFQEQPEESLRRVGSLHGLRAIVGEGERLQLFLMNKLPYERDGRRSGALLIRRHRWARRPAAWGVHDSGAPGGSSGPAWGSG